MRGLRFGLGSIALATMTLVASAPALACSPSTDPPTIKDLGPDQVVVLGTTGERVAAGRLFHVERWFNGGIPATPIVIAFKEGEPMGDCSYLVEAGWRLIIAPSMNDGGLQADLGTLQADPDTPQGMAYLEEAIALFGQGEVPPAAELPPGESPAGQPGPDVIPALVLMAALGLTVFGIVVLLGRRSRAGP